MNSSSTERKETDREILACRALLARESCVPKIDNIVSENRLFCSFPVADKKEWSVLYMLH